MEEVGSKSLALVQAHKRLRRIARKQYYQPWAHDVEVSGLRFALFQHTYSTGVILCETQEELASLGPKIASLEAELNLFTVLLTVDEANSLEESLILRRISDAMYSNTSHKTGRNGNPPYERKRTHSHPIKLNK